jgi:hypothetical protein
MKISKKTRRFLFKHKNINIVLSTIAIIWIWRGTWSITDLIIFNKFNFGEFLGYFIPLSIAYWYLLWNDSKLTELLHSTHTEVKEK